MQGQNRQNLQPGIMVDIVLKADQPTGKLTRGVVAAILTSKGIHPRGIKVRLTSGQVGRVQKIVDAPQTSPASSLSTGRPANPLPSGRGRKGEGRSRFNARGRTNSSFRSSAGRGRGRGGEKTFSRRPSAEEREFPRPQKSACACCGYLTIPARNAYEVCHVCYWEDDPAQAENPDKMGGSNHISLEQARKNFAQFGACEEKYAKAVRRPTAEEIPKS